MQEEIGAEQHGKRPRAGVAWADKNTAARAATRPVKCCTMSPAVTPGPSTQYATGRGRFWRRIRNPWPHSLLWLMARGEFATRSDTTSTDWAPSRSARTGSAADTAARASGTSASALRSRRGTLVVSHFGRMDPTSGLVAMRANEPLDPTQVGGLDPNRRVLGAHQPPAFVRTAAT